MTKFKKLFKKEDGFTLIEMSLVLFIISALLLLFIPNLSGRQDDANATSSEAIETMLQSQVDMYSMDEGTPTTFQELEGKDYLTSSQLETAEKNYTIVNGKVTANTN